MNIDQYQRTLNDNHQLLERLNTIICQQWSLP